MSITKEPAKKNPSSQNAPKAESHARDQRPDQKAQNRNPSNPQQPNRNPSNPQQKEKSSWK